MEQHPSSTSVYPITRIHIIYNIYHIIYILICVQENESGQKMQDNTITK